MESHNISFRVSDIDTAVFDLDGVLHAGNGHLVDGAIDVLKKAQQFFGREKVIIVSLNEQAKYICKLIGVFDEVDRVVDGSPNITFGPTSKAFLIEALLHIPAQRCVLFDDKETIVRNFRAWGGKAVLVRDMNIRNAWKEFMCSIIQKIYKKSENL